MDDKMPEIIYCTPDGKGGVHLLVRHLPTVKENLTVQPDAARETLNAIISGKEG